MRRRSFITIIHKYLFLLILFPTLLLLSLYTILCIPLYFHKKAAIVCLSIVPYVLWSLLSYLFCISFSVSITQKYKTSSLPPMNINAILISNHLGAIDFMIINEISKQYNMLQNSKYMVKESIKYIPILNSVKYLGFILLNRDYKKDAESIQSQLRFFIQEFIPFWRIIYPEGSRVSSKKIQMSRKYCEKKNLKPLINLLYPRTKGFVLSCEELKDHIEYVVDVSVMYDNGAVPSLAEFIFGIPCGEFVVNVEWFRLDEIGDYEKFLLDRFYAKDKWLEELAKKI